MILFHASVSGFDYSVSIVVGWKLTRSRAVCTNGSYAVATNVSCAAVTNGSCATGRNVSCTAVANGSYAVATNGSCEAAANVFYAVGTIVYCAEGTNCSCTASKNDSCAHVEWTGADVVGFKSHWRLFSGLWIMWQDLYVHHTDGNMNVVVDVFLILASAYVLTK